MLMYFTCCCTLKVRYFAIDNPKSCLFCHNLPHLLEITLEKEAQQWCWLKKKAKLHPRPNLPPASTGADHSPIFFPSETTTISCLSQVHALSHCYRCNNNILPYWQITKGHFFHIYILKWQCSLSYIMSSFRFFDYRLGSRCRLPQLGRSRYTRWRWIYGQQTVVLAAAVFTSLWRVQTTVSHFFVSWSTTTAPLKWTYSSTQINFIYILSTTRWECWVALCCSRSYTAFEHSITWFWSPHGFSKFVAYWFSISYAWPVSAVWTKHVLHHCRSVN